ncbi:hypothetical protein ACYCS5_28280 [Paenibacillus sp. SEL3]
MSNVANPNYELGLLYVSGILKEDDLLILRSNLKKNGIELKSFDKNGNITASIEDFTNVYSFLINSSLLAGFGFRGHRKCSVGKHKIRDITYFQKSKR